MTLARENADIHDGSTNITALGTVTAGNLSNADIVYPAGHVIQTTTVTAGSTNTDCNQGNGVWTPTVITASITPSGSSNSIIIFCEVFAYWNNSSADLAYSFKFKKVHSGGTSYPSPNLSQWGSATTYQGLYHNTGTGDNNYQHNLIYQDSAGGVTDSAITYTLECSEHNAESLVVGSGLSGYWKIWFQEIKR